MFSYHTVKQWGDCTPRVAQQSWAGTPACPCVEHCLVWAQQSLHCWTGAAGPGWVCGRRGLALCAGHGPDGPSARRRGRLHRSDKSSSNDPPVTRQALVSAWAKEWLSGLPCLNHVPVGNSGFRTADAVMLLMRVGRGRDAGVPRVCVHAPPALVCSVSLSQLWAVLLITTKKK